MEKKREWDREAAGEVFLASDPLYHCFFGIGDEKGELLKLLLVRQRHGEGARALTNDDDRLGTMANGEDGVQVRAAGVQGR
jgi:hypothetical protein